MEQIWNRLMGWGIDAPATLERMCGDKEFYIECLRDFVKDKNFPVLEAELQKQNVLKAFDAAHTLKGVASNLGLRPFAAIIAPLVEELRHGVFSENLEQRIAEIMACRADLCAILQPPT